MIINTQSSRVQDNRKTIVKLMLASHPDTCMVCDKGNSCQLRAIAADMGIGMVEFQQIPQLSSIENVNPFISRDLSKCILCAKCIRADQELVVIGAIDYTGRGFVSRPATLQNKPLEISECTFCGTCVALCPTGALMEKNKTCFGAPAKTVNTICPYCGCGCGISLGIKDNRIIHVRPDKNSPVNNGTLCVKGSYGYDFVHSPDRLTSPMVKTNGEFKKVIWEEALSLIADQLVRTKNTYGAESIAVFGSSKCTNEDNYVLQKFTRCVLGNNNIDNGSRLYGAAGYTGLGQTLGYPGTTNSLNALEYSEVILIIGANTSDSAPLVDYAIKRTVRNNGAKLVVIDPRCTKLASWAHLWLRPAFGTDAALINGIAKEIIEQGLHNEEHIERKTDNFGEMVASLSRYTLEYVAQITGVPSHDIQQAARCFAEAAQASIVYGNGLTQYACGTDSVVALANVAMLTGNVTGTGCGIYALQRENNGQGACDAGSLPDFLPGYQDIDDTGIRQLFEEQWKCKIPVQKGLTAIEMIASVGKGQIKAMYIVGENPVLSFPQTADVKNALSSLDFLVGQDIFITETAELATVVLPAACFAEKEGTVTNFEGRIQQLRKALEPPGESLPDWKITAYLSRKM
jgi:predicted molibdopterin-dependent oxidoreductase YjgC